LISIPHAEARRKKARQPDPLSFLVLCLFSSQSETLKKKKELKKERKLTSCADV